MLVKQVPAIQWVCYDLLFITKIKSSICLVWVQTTNWSCMPPPIWAHNSSLWFAPRLGICHKGEPFPTFCVAAINQWWHQENKNYVYKSQNIPLQLKKTITNVKKNYQSYSTSVMTHQRNEVLAVCKYLKDTSHLHSKLSPLSESRRAPE